MDKSVTVGARPINEFDEMLLRLQFRRTSLTRAIMRLRLADTTQWPRLIVVIIVALLRLQRANQAAMALLEVPNLSALLPVVTQPMRIEVRHRPTVSEDQLETTDCVASMEGKDSWKL